MAKTITEYKKLHLGCGHRYFKDWLNVDKFSKEADLEIDLEKTPWDNVPSNTFEEVYCAHTLEHLQDTQSFMGEVWRATTNNAKVTIIVPHFSSVAAASPFHKKTFNSQSMNYFTIDSPEKYGAANFKVESVKLRWFPINKDYINFSLKRKIASKIGLIIDFFANSNISFFERIWWPYVGGAFEIEWVLRTVKN